MLKKLKYVSPGALAGYSPEKELYAAGVKVELNKSFLAFVLHVFSITHSWKIPSSNLDVFTMCYIHIFRVKPSVLPETVFVSSCVTSGLVKRSRLDHLRTSATESQGNKGVQMLPSPVPVPVSLLLRDWKIFGYIWKARSILLLRAKTKWNPLSQRNAWDVEQKINWSSFDKR